MSWSKTRWKSSLLAYGVGLVICFASGMFTSVSTFISRLRLVKIDNENCFSDVFYVSLFPFQYLRRCALASPGQFLQHVSSPRREGIVIGQLYPPNAQ
jgi:hypothetical protein